MLKLNDIKRNFSLIINLRPVWAVRGAVLLEDTVVVVTGANGFLVVAWVTGLATGVGWVGGLVNGTNIW